MSIYRIGEIADMLGVSSETLRFYERKGLIRPLSSGDNSKYRYYSTWELHELLFARIYGAMGLPLDEVSNLLNDAPRSEKRALHSIRKRQEELQQQLALTQRCLERTQDMQRFLEDVDRCKRTPFLEERLRGSFYTLNNQRDDELSDETQVRSEFARWAQHPLFLFSTSTTPLEALRQGTPGFHFGIGVAEKYAGMLSPKVNEYTRYFPPQNCLYTVVETSDEDPLCCQRIRRLMDQHGLAIDRLTGDVTTHTILMMQKDEGFRCYHGVYFPISK